MNHFAMVAFITAGALAGIALFGIDCALAISLEAVKWFWEDEFGFNIGDLNLELFPGAYSATPIIAGGSCRILRRNYSGPLEL